MFWVQILCDDFNIVSWGFIVFCLVDLVVWTWNWTYFDWLWVMIEKWGYYWLLQVYFTAFLIATILLRIHFRQFLEAPTTRELGRGGGIVVITAFVVIFLCCSWAAARWLRWWHLATLPSYQTGVTSRSRARRPSTWCILSLGTAAASEGPLPRC